MIQVGFSEGLAREINGGLRSGMIKTRDGYPVRIVCWNAKGKYPIIGLIDRDGDEVPVKYSVDGKSDYRPNVTTNYDLELYTEGGEQ